MEIYRRYGPALLRKCERMLKNRADAEDVVQTLFVDLLQKEGKTDVDLPYLYRAATNRCLNLMRDSKRRTALLEREQTCLTPSRTLCENRVLDLDLVTKLAARLDRKTAEILVYHFVDDLTQEEIAELLHTSRKTVGKKLNKIRVELRRMVETDGGAA